MLEVGVLEARTRFSALIEGVEKGGEDVVITRHGRPVARLSSLTADAKAPTRRRFGDDDRVARLKRLGERLEQAYPDLAALTWDEMKALGRE